MGWLFGHKKNQKPDYTGLQLNTAVGTLPIPILWGRQKMSGNLIWYNGFTAYQAKAKGGKGGGKSHALSGLTGGDQTETNYRADIILALCEGPTITTGFTWKDQSISTAAYLMFNMITGVPDQPVWGWLSLFYPAQAVSYSGTAYMAAAWYQMGTTPTIGNVSFEVLGNMTGTGANGIDADPALVISDFLTNARYGAGFDPASIDYSTLYGASGDASLQTYCRALGIAFSPLISSQEADPASFSAGCRSSIAARCGAAASSSSSLTATARSAKVTSKPLAATSPSPTWSRPTAVPATICPPKSKSPRRKPSCMTAAWSTPRAAFRSCTSASSSFRRRTSPCPPAPTG
jgi:hypothetical protein